MLTRSNLASVAAVAVLAWLTAAQSTTKSQALDKASGGNLAAKLEQPLPTTGSTESRIGPLAFEGGYPTDATVTKLYDEMDFQRATQAYMWAIPIVSFAKWQEQHEKVFGQEDGDLVQMTSSRDKMGMLTPNDSTTYLLGFLSLERTGPLVIQYPKGPSAGGILDMWQRPITDMGLSGPDRGEGGKYLVIPPGQKAPKDVEGYRVVESPTNNLFHAFRVLATDPKEAETLKSGYQAYPYAKRDNPRKTRVISAEGKKWSGWPGNGLEFWGDVQDAERGACSRPRPHDGGHAQAAGHRKGQEV